MAFGYDDAAMLALGVAKAGMGAYTNRALGKRQKKMSGVQKASARREQGYELQDIGEARGDTEHQYNRDYSELFGQAAGPQTGQGRADSSWLADDATELKYQKDRRIGALDRAKERTMARGLDRERMWKYQKKFDKAKKTLDMVNSFLDSGATGAAGMMG